MMTLIRKRKSRKFARSAKTFRKLIPRIEERRSESCEMERWLLRIGHLPEANLSASLIGIYTDFT